MATLKQLVGRRLQPGEQQQMQQQQQNQQQQNQQQHIMFWVIAGVAVLVLALVIIHVLPQHHIQDKPPTVAVITCLFPEKQSVDTCIGNSTTKTGDSNVFTIGKIGGHNVVVTKHHASANGAAMLKTLLSRLPPPKN